MALKKLLGSNFRVVEGSAVIAQATSCQVTVSGNMESARTKDTPNGYDQEQMVSKQWSLQVTTIDASVETLRTYITMFNTQNAGGQSSSCYTGLPVGFDETSGTNNSTLEHSTDIEHSGVALLSDLNLQANNRTTCQLQLQLTGNGPLA